MGKIINFLKTNYAIIFILLLAAFLRLYRISDYLTFLGDEGRDVMVAKDILSGNLTLLGPRASAGDFFLGPIYYYMIAPFLWMFNFDPVGPAVMVALFGIATVFLVYYVGKSFFGKESGLIAASLYSISPLVLNYSRSSWNPNVMPFFSLLLLYLLYKAIVKKSWKRFMLVGFLLGISMQLHYLSVFLGVIVFVYLLLGDIFEDKKIVVREIISNYINIGFGFLVGLSPFLAFELRHGFPNTKTILGFIFNTTLKAGETQTQFISIIQDVFVRLFGRLLFAFPISAELHYYPNNVLFVWQFLTVIFALASILILIKHKQKQQSLLLVLWLALGVSLFGFYKKPIYDYYFGFMFPLPFLLFGNLLTSVQKFLKNGIFLTFFLLSFLFILNLYNTPLKTPANKQKEQTKTIAEVVISKTEDKPFNFAMISKGNSDHAYRYYFEILGHKPVTIENLLEDPSRKSVTNQLFIICEGPCSPLGYSLWEIAGFGRANIAGEWDVAVGKVYKLVHYSE